MRQIVLTAFALVVLVASCSQPSYYPKLRDVLVDTDSTAITAQLSIRKQFVTLSNDKLYFWYSNGIIGSNYGGYKGSLLHGEYLEQSKGGKLMVRGFFSTGLKNGEWKYWQADGQLARVERWDKGELKKVIIDASKTVLINDADQKTKRRWFKSSSRKRISDEGIKSENENYKKVQIDSLKNITQVDQISE